MHMIIDEFLKESFKVLLNEKYEVFKKNLANKNFCPDIEGVWKMYRENFWKNKGAYDLIESLLGLELYEDGKLNELRIALDEVNNMLNDLCTTYVAAIQKECHKSDIVEDEQLKCDE